MNLKVGIITQYKNGTARVFFDEDNLTTQFLPISYPFTNGNKACWPLKVKTQVWVVMDENCEDGLILGASYNEVDALPSNASNDIVAIEIEDQEPKGISVKKGSTDLCQSLDKLFLSLKTIVAQYGTPQNLIDFTTAETNIKKLIK